MKKVKSNQNYSYSWHKKLYDHQTIKTTLNAPKYKKKAKEEVKFLINLLQLNRKTHSILDIPCGTGRHCLPFGEKGFKITGVDLNDLCVKTAKYNCQKNTNITIKKGNMLKLKWAKGKFDLVINMYTSFGYFSTERENKLVLKGLQAALKPKGHIVIHIINRDWLSKIFQPVEWSESPTLFWLTGRKYNPKTKHIEAWTTYLHKKTGKGGRSYHRLRLYSMTEMKKLMKKSGLVKIKVFGNTIGDSSNLKQCSHLYYIGEKP